MHIDSKLSGRSEKNSPAVGQAACVAFLIAASKSVIMTYHYQGEWVAHMQILLGTSFAFLVIMTETIGKS